MGKGDKRTKKGKRIIGTSGVTRQKPVQSIVVTTKKKAPSKAKAAPKAETDTNDLSKKTVAELKEMAKAKDIQGISGMKKADLVAALS